MLLFTGTMFSGCGSQVSAPKVSVKETPLPVFNQEQSSKVMLDIVEKLNVTEIGAYPGVNPTATIEEFAVYHIAFNHRELVKNNGTIQLSDVQRIAQEYFAQEILQPVSTNRVKFNGDGFSPKPYGREWIDRYEIISLKSLSNEEYSLVATVTEEPTRFNHMKSPHIYLKIEAKFSRRMVGGKERFIVLEYRSTKVKDNNGNIVSGNIALSQGYKTYKNNRFGFSINYPETFIAGNAPANGDGLSFKSSDGRASLSVSGGNNSGVTMNEYFLLMSKGKTVNSVSGDNWFTISWKENGVITYCKMFVATATHNSFIISYPEEQKSQYDSIVSTLEESFKPGNIDGSAGKIVRANLRNNNDLNDFLVAMAHIPKDAKYYGPIVTQHFPEIFSPRIGETKMLGNVKVVWVGYSYYRDKNDISINPLKHSYPQNNNYVMEHEISYFSISLPNPSDIRTVSQAAFQAAVRVMGRPDSMYTTPEGTVNANWDNNRVMLVTFNDLIEFVWNAEN